MAHLLLCPFLTFPTLSIIPAPIPGSLQGSTFSLALYFDNDLLQHIVNQYARLHPVGRVNYQWNDLPVDKLRSFFGIFIATGLVLAKFQRLFVKSIPFLVDRVPWNHFENIKGRLH